MTKRVKIVLKTVLAGGLLAALTLLAWRLLHPEPSFQGKTVRRWLQQKADGSGDWKEVTNAFYHIGPKGVPYVVSRLRQDNSWLATHYREIWPQLPRFLRETLPQSREPIAEVAAVNAFRDMGPGVIPSLTALLEDDHPVVRSSAAWALESFRRSGHGNAVVIAALIQALADPDARVRLNAARALGEFGPEAKSAIAPLIARLNDDEKGADKGSVFFVRAAAARALGRIGPDAKAAAPMLLELSKDPHSYTRMVATIALWRIERNASVALPLLIDQLPKAEEPSKWEIFEALAEIGPAAKDAASIIKPDLKSRNPEVRQRAAEALWKIDPAQVTAIVEALIEPMNDPSATKANAFSVTEGARLLGEIGPAARSASPSLTKLLTHSYPPARSAAAKALQQIDHQTTSKTPSTQ